MLGSAQILVENGACAVLYSSDFTMPGTEIVKDVDFLVLDAAHASDTIVGANDIQLDREKAEHLTDRVHNEVADFNVGDNKECKR